MCVRTSFVLPQVLTGLASWTLEAGGGAGQQEKTEQHGSCQSHKTQKTERPSPSGATGRWPPPDNDQVTSAEWRSHQANRLTLTHRESKAAHSPPPPPPFPPPAIPPRLHPQTKNYNRSLLIHEVSQLPRKGGVRMSWKTLTDFMWVFELNFFSLFTGDSVAASINVTNDWEGIGVWTIILLVFPMISQKLQTPNTITSRQDALVAISINSAGGNSHVAGGDAKWRSCSYNFAHSFAIDKWFWKGKVCALSKDSDQLSAWCCAQRSSFDSAEITKRSDSLCHLEKRQCDTNLPI